MSGMTNCAAGKRVADMIKLKRDEDDFFTCKDSICSLQESDKPGIFYAGACTGPKTLPDTLHEARAAALAIHNYIKNRE